MGRRGAFSQHLEWGSAIVGADLAWRWGAEKSQSEPLDSTRASEMPWKRHQEGGGGLGQNRSWWKRKLVVCELSKALGTQTLGCLSLTAPAPRAVHPIQAWIMRHLQGALKHQIHKCTSLRSRNTFTSDMTSRWGLITVLMKIQSFISTEWRGPQELQEAWMTVSACFGRTTIYGFPDLTINGQREEGHTHLETGCLKLYKPQNVQFTNLCVSGWVWRLSRHHLQTKHIQTLRDLFISKGEFKMFCSCYLCYFVYAWDCFEFRGS